MVPRVVCLLLCVAVASASCRPAPEPKAQPVPESAELSAPSPEAPRRTVDWTPRTPAEIRAQGNHLKDEGSVYLRQHAHNPLEWYPWGKEALTRSLEEDKPIFLSIGYASCHWCHVMEEVVFAHDDVAAFMNEHYVCIKVDREERPDLDTIYMDAVQSLTGRGGWPMTVLLTPSLKPFYGGTYFPKKRFMGIVRNALDRFTNERNQVESDGDETFAKIARIADARPGGAVRARTLQSIVNRVKGGFDTQWGGLRGRMKFPTPVRWRFLLHAYRKWGDEEVAAGVRRTLDQMASGGIHDQLGGGFHRYTVEPTWLIPHFEKMLYDNGQLAVLFLEAAAAFDEPHYLAVAQATLDFLLVEMLDAKGGFYASYDADSGGEEGTFYVWTPAQVAEIAGARDAEVLTRLLGITERGNFEHKTSVLTRRISFADVGKGTGRKAAAVEAIWNRAKPLLYAARAKRVWPGLDKKLVTAWNGLAISAMARGYAATGDERYRQAAERAVSRLWRLHRYPEGGLYRASTAGRPVSRGILDDYAFLAVGLLDLYDATGSKQALQRAMILVREANARFSRSEGGWYLTEGTDDSLITRPFDPHDSVRPSGNSMMLESELRLAALRGDGAQYDKVAKTLGAYANMVARSGLSTAGWADVALRLLGPYYDVIIAGEPQDRRTQALTSVWQDIEPSWAVRSRVAPAGPSPEDEKLLPTLAGKLGRDGGPLAYVCVRGTCKAPTADPKAFRKQLMDGWAH